MNIHTASLHELSLVDLSDPPLQFLWVLGEELELGAVTLRVFPRVIVSNFSCKMSKNANEMWASTFNDCFNSV